MRDLNGSELKEGDQVLMPLALGNLVIGTLLQVNSGLATPSNPQAVPSVVVRMDLLIPAMPNGVVGGVVKLSIPAPVL